MTHQQNGSESSVSVIGSRTTSLTDHKARRRTRSSDVLVPFESAAAELRQDLQKLSISPGSNVSHDLAVEDDGSDDEYKRYPRGQDGPGSGRTSVNTSILEDSEDYQYSTSEEEDGAFDLDELEFPVPYSSSVADEPSYDTLQGDHGNVLTSHVDAKPPTLPRRSSRRLGPSVATSPVPGGLSTTSSSPHTRQVRGHRRTPEVLNAGLKKPKTPSTLTLFPPQTQTRSAPPQTPSTSTFNSSSPLRRNNGGSTMNSERAVRLTIPGSNISHEVPVRALSDTDFRSVLSGKSHRFVAMDSQETSDNLIALCEVTKSEGNGSERREFLRPIYAFDMEEWKNMSQSYKVDSEREGRADADPSPTVSPSGTRKRIDSALTTNTGGSSRLRGRNVLKDIIDKLGGSK